MTENQDEALALARRVQLAEEAPAMLAALRGFMSDNRADNDGNTVAFLVPVEQYQSAAAILARIDGDPAAPTT